MPYWVRSSSEFSHFTRKTRKKSRYLCNSRTDLHKIWHVDVERAYQVHRSLKISFQKSKMADSRYTWDTRCTSSCKKVKVAPLPINTRRSVGFRSWSRFLAVSLQVMWVINPAVGCYYYTPGLQLPRTLKRAATNFAAWWTEAWWVWTVCLGLLPDSVAAAIWTQALLRLSPAR